MTFIWATRGKAWGFTFLETAGRDDPLIEFEQLTAGIQGLASGYTRTHDGVAVKFRDPEGRKDRSGRQIPHTFVLFGDLARQIDSVEDALSVVWPLVADDYAAVWELPEAPDRSA